MLAIAVGALLAPVSRAQQKAKVTVKTNETLFTTGLNQYGYDEELSVSDPLRAQVRPAVAKTEVTRGSVVSLQGLRFVARVFYLSKSPHNP